LAVVTKIPHNATHIYITLIKMLSNDIIRHIFRYLSDKDILHLCLASKLIYSISGKKILKIRQSHHNTMWLNDVIIIKKYPRQTEIKFSNKVMIFGSRVDYYFNKMINIKFEHNYSERFIIETGFGDRYQQMRIVLDNKFNILSLELCKGTKYRIANVSFTDLDAQIRIDTALNENIPDGLKKISKENYVYLFDYNNVFIHHDKITDKIPNWWKSV
jgi:hypothetical protein